jgi:hypothetical protein
MTACPPIHVSADGVSADPSMTACPPTACPPTVPTVDDGVSVDRR